LPVHFALPDGLALVVGLLAAGQAHGELDLPALEIEAERNQCHSLLDGLPDEFPDLLTMQQQLAAPRRLVVGVAAVCVLRDVDVVDEDLPALDTRVAVAQVDAALADRLHLRALQDNAGLERLEDVVVVERLPVLRDDSLCFLALSELGHGSAPPGASRAGSLRPSSP